MTIGINEGGALWGIYGTWSNVANFEPNCCITPSSWTSEKMLSHATTWVLISASSHFPRLTYGAGLHLPDLTLHASDCRPCWAPLFCSDRMMQFGVKLLPGYSAVLKYSVIKSNICPLIPTGCNRLRECSQEIAHKLKSSLSHETLTFLKSCFRGRGAETTLKPWCFLLLLEHLIFLFFNSAVCRWVYGWSFHFL